MYGNLKVFGGQQVFDTYAEHLRTIGEPILPREGFLWLFRSALIASLIGHAYSAFYLWSKANGARRGRDAVRLAGSAMWRSQAMRWGGVALLAFLVFHLIQFTTNKVNFNSGMSDLLMDGSRSPYFLVVASFQLWWVVLIYLVALAALGLHLHHGVWSAAQTLGWTTSPAARLRAKSAAMFIAVLVVAGFALPPLSILFGIVE
jgi:succinate dehydrogenase / fumarate reductase cytochrome b subunit